MREIRIHGRGGQGAVSTGQILAIAAFYDKKESQTFPMFGLERMGAPVTAFVRIDDSQIRIRNEIYFPDCVIVLDPSLILAVDVAKGVKKGGVVIVNSSKSPKELGLKGNFDVHCIDADSVGMKIFGKPIVNTSMIGAYAKITGDVSIDSLKKAIEEVFMESKGGDIVDKNKKAVEEVFNQAK